MWGLNLLAVLTPVDGTTSKFHLLDGTLVMAKNSKTLSMVMCTLARKVATNTTG
jgi:hypothetical protein